MPRPIILLVALLSVWMFTVGTIAFRGDGRHLKGSLRIHACPVQRDLATLSRLADDAHPDFTSPGGSPPAAFHADLGILRSCPTLIALPWDQSYAANRALRATGLTRCRPTRAPPIA